MSVFNFVMNLGLDIVPGASTKATMTDEKETNQKDFVTCRSSKNVYILW